MTLPNSPEHGPGPARASREPHLPSSGPVVGKLPIKLRWLKAIWALGDHHRALLLLWAPHIPWPPSLCGISRIPLLFYTRKPGKQVTSWACLQAQGLSLCQNKGHSPRSPSFSYLLPSSSKQRDVCVWGGVGEMVRNIFPLKQPQRAGPRACEGGPGIFLWWKGWKGAAGGRWESSAYCLPAEE